MIGEPAERAPESYTLDGFLDGGVTLVQPRGGHRAGLDAALLQAVVPANAKGHAMDLGAGVGTVGFAVAARAPGLAVTCVERAGELIACAEMALRRPDNAAFASRVRLVHADVSERREAREERGLHDGTADFVLMNPPYDAPERVRPSPDISRRGAHIAEPGALSAWCRSAAGLLKPGGLLGLIHRPAALPDILAALNAAFGAIRVLPVHPSGDKPAGRIVVLARNASRGPLRLMHGLILHDAGGGWTEEADAILRGRAELDLG